MTQLSDEVVERVARAICWAMAEEGDICSIRCMNARRCTADKLSECFMRDARAAIAAYEAKGDIPLDEG
jgi:hypothetical protein